MVTAISWRGFPSFSRSSPPSLTLCYARRLHEKDTSAVSRQPDPSGCIYSLSLNLSLVTYGLVFMFGHQIGAASVHSAINTVDVPILSNAFWGLTGPALRSSGCFGCVCSKRQAQSNPAAFEWIFNPEIGARFLEGIKGLEIFLLSKQKNASMFIRCYDKLRSVNIPGLKLKQVQKSNLWSSFCNVHLLLDVCLMKRGAFLILALFCFHIVTS